MNRVSLTIIAFHKNFLTDILVLNQISPNQNTMNEEELVPLLESHSH